MRIAMPDPEPAANALPNSYGPPTEVGDRWTRWRRRLPFVPVTLGVAVRIAWALYVRSRPLPELCAGIVFPASASRPTRDVTRKVPPPPFDAVALAHRLLPLGTPWACLPRSLVVAAVLHRMGHRSVALCLGVRRDLRTADRASRLRPAAPGVLRVNPFYEDPLAHAWVEVDGRPLAEPSDPHASHALLYRFPTPLH